MNHLAILASSGTTANTIVQGIVTGVICVIILGCLFYIVYRKKKQDTETSISEEINNILDNITDIVIDTLLAAIKDINFDDYETIADAQAEFLTGVYDKVYDYIFGILEEEYKDKQNIIELCHTLLTRERVEDFVNEIFGREEIQSKLIDQYNSYIEAKTASAEAEDQEAEAEGEQYENGTIPTDDNPPVEDLDPTKIPGVEEGELIPQEEKEEETVDLKNDPSVEVVKTETVSIEDAIEKASEE